ncbi:hypothetical protein C8J57DRAFT_945587, partial [Mycena rebaudengoi]
MSSATTLTDTLPSSVPALKSNGENFTIYSLRFRASVSAKGYMGHFDGTATRPVFTAPITQVQSDELERWDKAEANSKTLLLQKIPDSLAIQVDSLPTVADAWALIYSTFANKGTYAQTNLRSDFLQ